MLPCDFLGQLDPPDKRVTFDHMAIKDWRKSGFAVAWRRLEAAYCHLTSLRIHLAQQTMQNSKGDAGKAKTEVWGMALCSFDYPARESPKNAVTAGHVASTDLEGLQSLRWRGRFRP